MRELWWFAGTVRYRLTGADPERTLCGITELVRIKDLNRISDLTMEFTVAASSRRTVEQTANRFGDRLELLHRRGLPVLAKRVWAQPILLGTVMLLLLAALILPRHILFFQVEGNSAVHTRRILEEAAGCGLTFGASRGSVRSEQIKNRLLSRIPELSWVGVNTSGCVATISVRERQSEPETEAVVPGNVVAAMDGIITSLVAESGTPLCRVGDGVRSGQVLISGYTDLGLCTHVEPASGEVFALTRREMDSVIPTNTLLRSDQEETVKKYSLLLGKKRINLHSDSGILYTGCGKMTQIRMLRLPGGWTLPAALVIETYAVAEQVSEARSESSALAMLEEAGLAHTKQNMIAGEILNTETNFLCEYGVYRLVQRSECREMIGRFSSGILTEGDTHDGENGQRGTG